MIQRIQSLYLLLAGLFVSAVLFLPLYKDSEERMDLVIKVNGAKLMQDGTIMGPANTEWINTLAIILIALVIALCVGTIFLFNNRPLQAKLAKLGGLLNLCLLVSLLFVVEEGVAFYVNPEADPANYVYYVYALPIIAGVLCYLASRAIIKDEALVRASDRLR